MIFAPVLAETLRACSELAHTIEFSRAAQFRPARRGRFAHRTRCLSWNAAIIERRSGGNRRDPQMRPLLLTDRRRYRSRRADGIAWKAGAPRLHDLNVFSAGFALGVLGTYISAWLNRYRRIA